MSQLDSTAAAAANALQALFDHIARTRMVGLPLLQPGLQVQALGFEPLPGEPSVALGVLITPWFMNLVRLPLDAAAEASMSAPTQRAQRRVGAAAIDFIGSQEAPVGRFECCSLYSPMHAFRDQASAVAVAEAVLKGLRDAARSAPEQPARRGFLLGRAQGAAA
jgi:[NiFe] hydrogenase assembly HybE family chaperone